MRNVQFSWAPKQPKRTSLSWRKVEKTKYIPAADFDNLINGMHAADLARCKHVAYVRI